MITERQLARRSEYIGGSEIPAILGVDIYQNAADIFASKVFGMDRISNEAMQMGNLLEPVVAQLAEPHLGKMRAVGTERRIKDTPCLIHVDRIVVADRNPVEIKTAGLLTPYGADRDEWGEAGTDEVPERVIVQAAAQMAATDRPVCHVPALLGGRGFVMFKINFDEELWRHILSKVTAFWVNHVEPKIPPTDILPSLETIKRIKREPGKTIPATEEIVAAWGEWERAKVLQKDTDELFDERDRAIKAMFGDAEEILLPDGRRLTYLAQKRTDPDREAMKSDGVWDKYAKESSYRVLRIKKGK